MTHKRLITEMSTSELIHWMAFFQRERREQERAQQQAKDNAEAQRVASRMAGRYR
jgi:competence protein ComGF